MIILVIIVHVVVCVGLVLAILLHSGKGAGLSNVFGGGLPSSFSGTSMIEKNLDRITIGLSIAFAITTFILMIAMPHELATVPPAQQQTTTSTPSPGGQTPGGQTPAPGQSSPTTSAPQ